METVAKSPPLETVPMDAQAFSDAEPAAPEQRRQERSPWVTGLTIWVREKGMEYPRELKVQAHDLSRGGFSFLHSQFLHTDTFVTIRLDTLPGQPIVDGAVTSCVYVGKRLHRVGVQFLRSSKLDR